MATLNGFDFYGGATVSRTFDSAGAEYIACCARKKATGIFGFYIFRNGIEVPYAPFCTGRGSINGGGWWIAAKDSEFFTGQIPGFVGWPAAGPGPVGPQGPQGVPGPIGPQGPQGPVGSGSGSLGERYTKALERLCAFFGI